MIWFSAADCNNTHSKRQETLLSALQRGRERLLRSLGCPLEERGSKRQETLLSVLPRGRERLLKSLGCLLEGRGSKRQKTLLSTLPRGREHLLRSLGCLLEGREQQTTLMQAAPAACFAAQPTENRQVTRVSLLVKMRDKRFTSRNLSGSPPSNPTDNMGVWSQHWLPLLIRGSLVTPPPPLHL